MDVLDARAQLAPIAELAADHVAQVVRVDDQLGDAVRDEVRDPVREDRDAAHRHRLGPLGAERAERYDRPAHRSMAARAPPWHTRAGDCESGGPRRRRPCVAVARTSAVASRRLARCFVPLNQHSRSRADRRARIARAAGGGRRGAGRRVPVRSGGAGRRGEAVRRRPGRGAARLRAWDGGALAGVAAVAADRLRVLAVAPPARGRGIGGALLAACADAARAAGQRWLRALDRSPATTSRPASTSATPKRSRGSTRRGWRRPPGAPPRINLLVDVRGQLGAAFGGAGGRARRARHRRGLRDPARPPRRARAPRGGGDRVRRRLAVRARARARPRPGGRPRRRPRRRLLRLRGARRQQPRPGWFGPAGTWPAHRGRGLGEALLLACLVDVAAAHAQCEVA